MTFLPEIIYGIVFLAGNFGVWQWRRRQDDPDIFFFCSIFSLTSLFLYLAYIELRHGSCYLLIPLSAFLFFLLHYFRNKARLSNGMIFNIFILLFGAYLLWNILLTGSLIVGGIISIVAVILFMTIAFGLISLVIFLYWNGIVVLRKESRSLANLLTLLLAIFLTFYLILDYFLLQSLPLWLTSLLAFLPMVMFYFFIVFYNFLTVSVLYQFNHPRYQQDFIVVLGAGLIDGRTVSPLLARRIDTGISFYRRQKKATGKVAKLVMSGGKGDDEHISEAAAMRNYALENGVPEADILMEDQSVNTLENMKFSKALIAAQGIEKPQVIFTSNNYHIFRAAIYADWAQLKADGIGAKTALYYLPNAFLREYVAILMMNKRRHLVVAIFLFCIALMFSLISLFIR